MTSLAAPQPLSAPESAGPQTTGQEAAEGATATSATFAHGATRVDVSTKTEAVLEWLDYFLRPWFSPDAEGTNRRARVELVVDSHEYQRIAPADEATEAADVVPVFLLDSGLVSLPVVGVEDQASWIADAYLRALYRVGRSADVRVLAADGRHGARVALMRVVRELAMIGSAARGEVLLHASVAAWRGGAVAFCGPKRSGKTTLLLRNLLAGDSTFLANDRAIAVVNQGGVTVRGLPTIIALRGDTIDRFPGLSELRTIRDRHWQIPGEMDPSKAVPWTESGAPIDLAPQSLCAALGVRAQADAPLRAVVFPRVNSTVTGARPVRISSAEAQLRLRDSIVGAHLPSRRADALWPTQTAAPAIDTMAALAQLPSFELVLGADSDAQPAVPDEIARFVD